MFAKSNYTLSSKNISIPPRHIYTEKLALKAIQFMRWLKFRVHFHENPLSKTERREFYGLKSDTKPPDTPESLKGFEREFWSMIKNVKFRRNAVGRKNHFQRDLKSKIFDLTKNQNNVVVKGDKSHFLYHCPKTKYHQTVLANLRKFYQKEPKNRPEIVEKINDSILKFGMLYNVVERIKKIVPRDVFLTLKDHKQNFETNEPCRLINPTKSDLGVLSKRILDKVLIDIRKSHKPKLFQFKNTDECLDWFKDLQLIERRAFLTFDICDFYPSITKEILKKALFWAQKHAKNGILDDTDIDLILAARISMLAYKGDIWVEKTGEFDVTMGSPDGAEVSELVGLYLLYELSFKNFVPQFSCGLYRDDGVVALRSSNGRRQELIRQDLRKFFLDFGFKIDISPAQHFVDYLDVRLHTNQVHEIYYKPDSDPKYVHIQSNHPRSVLKNFKNNTENRLSKLCSNVETFDRHAQRYKDILANSGHPSDIKFGPTTAKIHKKRKRNITVQP